MGEIKEGEERPLWQGTLLSASSHASATMLLLPYHRPRNKEPTHHGVNPLEPEVTTNPSPEIVYAGQSVSDEVLTFLGHSMISDRAPDMDEPQPNCPTDLCQREEKPRANASGHRLWLF